MSNPSLDPLVADIPDSERRLLQTTDAIAARIGTLMRERGLNQSALADKVRKSKSYVSRVLSGTVNLTLKTVAEFEAALGGDVVTVPAWEPPYPRRRRQSSAPMPEVEVHAVEPTREKALSAGLPDELCDRLGALAKVQNTSVDALVTMWVTERLEREAAAPPEPMKLLSGAYATHFVVREWEDFRARMTGHWMVGSLDVGLPTGYDSSPFKAAGSARKRPCVDQDGNLVTVEAGLDAYTSFDPEDSGR